MAKDLSNKETTLTKAEYRQAATQLYNGEYPGVDFSVPFSKAKIYLGKPVFAGVEHVVINAGGGTASVRNLETRKAAKTRQAKARSEALLLDPAALAELDRLEKGGFFSEGRSKAGFLAKRLEDEKAFEQELERYRQITGVELDNGHMTTRENNSPQARAAELRRVNQAKGAKQPIDLEEMSAAGLPLSDLDDVLSYEAGTGTNAQADFAARTAMQNAGMSGEQAMALTDRKLQLAAQGLPSQSGSLSTLGLAQQTIELTDLMAQAQGAEPGEVKEASRATTQRREQMGQIAQEKGGLFGMPDFGITERVFGKSLVQDERQELSKPRLVDQFSAVQRRLIDRAQTYEEKDALITLFKNQ
jgi:hypothetical protein